MQPVGQLDEHYADVIDHGQHHLAQILGLLLFACCEINFADFSYAFDDVSNLLSEFFANVDDSDRSVFDRIVQQAGGHCDRIHFHFGEDERNFQRMDKVRLSGGPALTFMIFQRIIVGFLDDGEIVLRTILLHPLHQIAELGQGKSGGRDLLAQARHVRL